MSCVFNKIHMLYILTISVSADALFTAMYGLRMSKWKAGVSNRRFLAHFLPPAMTRPSPSHGIASL